MNRTKATIVLGGVLGGTLLALAGVPAVIAQARPDGQPPAQPASQPGSQPGAPVTGPEMIKQLVDGLKSVDGCLGVELARGQSGKSMIIAWFKDAESCRVWYSHPAHARMLEMAGSDPAAGKPLEHVKDGTPVMVIASMTPAQTPQIEGMPIPISQLSIELFAPLPGGASINGRLSPEAFPVEHHKAK